MPAGYNRAAKYPENIIETIKGLGVNVIALDALSIAEELGNAKCKRCA